MLEVFRFMGWDELLFLIEEVSLLGKELIGKFISGEGWWECVSLFLILYVDMLMIV